ncbi:MAG: hypothetical protein IKU10_00645, partial [Clostridia bacterium]|nr:hypothetical protein [Clostridia bacterium]
SKVYGWEYGAIAFSGYPALITHMQRYLHRHPDSEKQAKLNDLKNTLAAYVFADGSIPLGIFNPNPLFTVTSGGPEAGGWVSFVMDYLGDDWTDPTPVTVPAIHRTHKNFAWKQNGPYWSIETDGVRQYAGYSRVTNGIVKGEGEPVVGSFDVLDSADVVEIID